MTKVIREDDKVYRKQLLDRMVEDSLPHTIAIKEEFKIPGTNIILEKGDKIALENYNNIRITKPSRYYIIGIPKKNHLDYYVDWVVRLLTFSEMKKYKWEYEWDEGYRIDEPYIARGPFFYRAEAEDDLKDFYRE